MKKTSQPKPDTYFQVTYHGSHWIAPMRFFLTLEEANAFSREKLEWLSPLVGQPVANLSDRFTTVKVNMNYHPETQEIISVYRHRVEPPLPDRPALEDHALSSGGSA